MFDLAFVGMVMYNKKDYINLCILMIGGIQGIFMLYRQIRKVSKSRLFDASWYVREYPDVMQSKMKPAEHYVKKGWMEGKDPSELFKTEEYLEINKDVRDSGMCPLYHFETKGRYEGRRMGIELTDANNDIYAVKKNYHILKLKIITCMKSCVYSRIKIKNRQILFRTFQNEYTCNPKYICEALLRRKPDYDIYWVIGKNSNISAFPKNVHLVLENTRKLNRIVATSKVIIDNGVASFSDSLNKKRKQVGICTWHGSLGFKKIGISEKSDDCDKLQAERYNKYHDYLITNSTFEENVFKESFWPNAELLKFGHARNDILLNQNNRNHLREKVFKVLGLREEYKYAMYAPTVNSCGEGELTENDFFTDENIRELIKALSKKFGGEWRILYRHHHEDTYVDKIDNEAIMDVSDYIDIQELMVCIDAGITDYSSWILDYILTKKPAFIYAYNKEAYEQEKGFFYPIENSPIPVAKNYQELIENINNWSSDKYENAIERFLNDKGCYDDGMASERIADKIIQITGKD